MVFNFLLLILFYNLSSFFLNYWRIPSNNGSYCTSLYSSCTACNTYRNTYKRSKRRNRNTFKKLKQVSVRCNLKSFQNFLGLLLLNPFCFISSILFHLHFLKWKFLFYILFKIFIIFIFKILIYCLVLL